MHYSSPHTGITKRASRDPSHVPGDVRMPGNL